MVGLGELPTDDAYRTNIRALLQKVGRTNYTGAEVEQWLAWMNRPGVWPTWQQLEDAMTASEARRTNVRAALVKAGHTASDAEVAMWLAWMDRPGVWPTWQDLDNAIAASGIAAVIPLLTATDVGTRTVQTGPATMVVARNGVTAADIVPSADTGAPMSGKLKLLLLGGAGWLGYEAFKKKKRSARR